MSGLSEHVDRLSYLAQSIRSAAAAAASTPTSSSGAGPFTDAVLHTHLGDLIRDIDPAEIGLFSLVPPAKQGPAHAIKDAEPSAPPHGELTRVAFVGATPLRKPPAPRPGRPDAQRVGEHDPEVYAGAALKYLERYQSIRPMPRASEQVVNIMERLETVRANIHALNDQLKQHANAGPSQPPLSPKSMMKEEERRIQDVQTQMVELKKRRDVLLKQKASRAANRAPPKAKQKPKPQTPQQSTSPPDAQEVTFWNTPGVAARTLHFTGDSLLDEHVSIADVSALSFGSPVSARAKSKKRASASPHSPAETDDSEVDEPMRRLVLNEPPEVHDASDRFEQEEDLDEDEEEQTVVLRKPPTLSSRPSTLQDTSLTTPSPQSEPPSPVVSAQPPAETPSRGTKFRVTTEMERIVTRIWATIGEIILPGRRFDATSGGKPPRAKETIAHLQTLSTRTPAPTSPTGSSLSSLSHAAPPSGGAPTAHQVLTAHMLLALLGTPPAYALPLNTLKEALTARTKAAGAGIALGGSGITRPIYACVAKRLLKIDRGGGEQVVKFDV